MRNKKKIKEFAYWFILIALLLLKIATLISKSF